MLPRRVLLTALCGAMSPIAWGQSLSGIVSRCRPSILAVGTFSAMRSPRFTFSGTGFVIGDGTVVATCLHVVPDVGLSSERVDLVVQWRSDQGEMLWRRAKVLAQDRGRDLCLLKMEGAALPSLAVSDQDSVDAAEGSAVVLMGYPIGGALGFSVVTHRGMVSSRVNSISPAPSASSLSDLAVKGARAGAFDLLQLDATAYPGNSGGPVINADTVSVVGVVSMVLVKSTRESALTSPTGITYAVPSKYVGALLKQI